MEYYCIDEIPETEKLLIYKMIQMGVIEIDCNNKFIISEVELRVYKVLARMNIIQC